MRNYIVNCIQRFAVNCSKWRSEISAVPQESIMWSVGFSITNDMQWVWVCPQQVCRWYHAEQVQLICRWESQKGFKAREVGLYESHEVWRSQVHGPGTCIMAFPNICTHWEMNRLGAALWGRTWGYWWMKNWTWDTNVRFSSESQPYLGLHKKKCG